MPVAAIKSATEGRLSPGATCTVAEGISASAAASVRSSSSASSPWPNRALLAATGIVPSKSAARRVISEGGAYLNNRRVTGEDDRPDPVDLLQGRFLVVRRGKRTVGGVEIISG